MTEPTKSRASETPEPSLADLRAPAGVDRSRLPDTRRSITHKFNISGHEGYIIIGLYEDDRPGEVFLKVSKKGSTVRGLMDTVGVLTSLALQYGVPLETLAAKFEYSRFEPSGWTSNPEIGHARSIIDYVFRWLGCHFSDKYRQSHPPLASMARNVTDKTLASGNSDESEPA